MTGSARRQRAGKGADYGADRKQGHPDIQGFELGDYALVAPDAKAYEKEQRAEGVECQIAPDESFRHYAGQAGEDAEEKKPTITRLPFMTLSCRI